MTILGYAELAWVNPARFPGLTYCSLLCLNRKCPPKLKTWSSTCCTIERWQNFQAIESNGMTSDCQVCLLSPPLLFLATMVCHFALLYFCPVGPHDVHFDTESKTIESTSETVSQNKCFFLLSLLSPMLSPHRK